MSVRLILHIGTNKTGTTAIQACLSSHRELLVENGVLYPIVGLRHEAHYDLSSAMGFGPKHLHLNDKERLKALKRYRAELHDEVVASGCHTVVLSSEYWMLKRPVRRVREFLDSYDVKVIVYFRRHDFWLESVYSQSLRTPSVVHPPWGRGFESWLHYREARGAFHGVYRTILDHWSSVFGEESIIARPYEGEQNRPSIFHDFLWSASLEDIARDLDCGMGRRNERLSREAMAFLDEVQRLDFDEEKRKRLIQYACSLGSGSARLGVSSPKLRRRLIEQNKSDYEYIARRFLGREDGRLFYERLPDPEDDWQPIIPLSRADLEHGILRALQDDRSEVDQLSEVDDICKIERAGSVEVGRRILERVDLIQRVRGDDSVLPGGMSDGKAGALLGAALEGLRGALVGLSGRVVQVAGVGSFRVRESVESRRGGLGRGPSAGVR